VARIRERSQRGTATHGGPQGAVRCDSRIALARSGRGAPCLGGAVVVALARSQKPASGPPTPKSTHSIPRRPFLTSGPARNPRRAGRRPSAGRRQQHQRQLRLRCADWAPADRPLVACQSSAWHRLRGGVRPRRPPPGTTGDETREVRPDARAGAGRRFLPLARVSPVTERGVGDARAPLFMAGADHVRREETARHRPPSHSLGSKRSGRSPEEGL
jgi:hypothetical protein